MNKYKKIISDFERLTRKIRDITPRHSKATAPSKGASKESSVLIFSPHPDDECITGGLALRLKREAGMNVVNVAVTLGNNPKRRQARLRELKAACRCLGFDLVVAGQTGLRDVNLITRKQHRSEWSKAVNVITAIIRQNQPTVILLPHAKDVHPTHVGTHHLVIEALKNMPAGFQCSLVETEYWGQMPEPNLLAEIGANELADMVAALSLHRGEVKRNAYHARLPGWMLDNVRRAEAVCGAGSSAPDFAFGVIHRVRLWNGRRLVQPWSGGKVLSSRRNAASFIPRLRSS